MVERISGLNGPAPKWWTPRIARRRRGVILDS